MSFCVFLRSILIRLLYVRTMGLI